MYTFTDKVKLDKFLNTLNIIGVRYRVEKILGKTVLIVG